MPEIILQKRLDGAFAALTPEDDKYLKRVKVGDIITIDYKRPRNPDFHKKWFSLMNYAFEQWEPDEDLPEKHFETFRKNITCLAGFYDEVPTVRNTIRVVAKSISFGNMEQDEFEDLYDKTIDALLKWVLKNHTKDDVHAVMQEIAGYA